MSVEQGPNRFFGLGKEGSQLFLHFFWFHYDFYNFVTDDYVRMKKSSVFDGY